MSQWSRAPANAPHEQGVVGSKHAPAEKIVFVPFLLLFDHSEMGLAGAGSTVFKNQLFTKVHARKN